MSAESYSTLDESSLRALLDGTMDLDERRLIRSAIRELRRREIQDMEAALASKRFRHTQVQPQEDKENQHRSESSGSLDILSQKLQGIKDIDELTKMLRSASEYEERKVIRAAIRQIREEQQQVERCKVPGNVDNKSGVGTQYTERDSVAERGHIQPTLQRTEEHKTGSRSGMMLVFDSLVKDEGPLPILIQEPQLVPGHRHRSDSTSSDTSTSSVHSYSTRLNSGASDQSQGMSQRGRLDSAASDHSGSSLSQHRLDLDQSDSSPCVRLGSSERSVSVCSDDRDPTQEPEPVTNGSAHSTNSETDTKHMDQTDGAVLSRQGPKQVLTNGSVKGKTEFLTQKITINNSLTNGKPKDAVLEHFTRTNSVRDRMRKFTEFTQNSAPVMKSAPLRNGRNATTSTMNTFFIPTTAPNISSGTSGDGSAPSSSFGESHRGPGGVTDQPLSTAGQSQSPEGGTEPGAEKDATGLSGSEVERNPRGEPDADMKTFLTIEIKDGRTTGTSSTGRPIRDIGPRITANSLGQRAELTLGLRATPFKSFTSAPTIKMETEPCVASEPMFSALPSVQVAHPTLNIPNGSPSQTIAVDRPGKLTAEQLAAIEDEELLDKMLDESKDFEERRLIRAAMRDLRKRKRDQREKEQESRLQALRQQRDQRTPRAGAGAGAGEVVMRKVEKSADGNTLSQVTKTDRFADDGSRSTRSTVVEASYVQKTDAGTIQSKSYSYSSSSSSSTSISSTTTKKVGSVFDREDDSASRGAVERRQAERRKELMRAQTMPKSSMQARKAMIDRLEPGGSSGSPAVSRINKVQRSTSFGVPNANSIKQMLLDWCRVKTHSYEHVDIQNFSSSWSDGMAFCALVHHFFPEAFDYSALSPSNRRHNFEVAFSTAEKMVDCPQLLDVEDMVKMREPDWKCVYTYLQEFYRGLVTKGLVKTRNNS